MYNENSGYRPRNNFSPVREGDELDVTIEAVGEKGDGIAKKEGFVIFIPNTKTGDTVRIKVSRVLKNMAFAEVAGDAAPAQEAGSDDTEEAAEEDTETEEEAQAEDSEDFGDDEAESEEDTETKDDDEEPKEEETAEDETTEEAEPEAEEEDSKKEKKKK